MFDQSSFRMNIFLVKESKKFIYYLFNQVLIPFFEVQNLNTH